MRKFYLGVLMIAVATFCVAAVSPVCAQVTFSSDALWETMSNRYIGINLGVRGTVKSGNGPDWPITARWSTVTAEGDPESTDDNNKPMVYFAEVAPCDYFGYWKIMVGTRVYLVGDTNTGYWSKTPLAYTTPPAGYGVGRAGGYIEGEWTISDKDAQGNTVPLVSMWIKMSIVRDQCRFETVLTNRWTTSQTIGLCMTADGMVGASDFGVGYACIAGSGYVRSAALAPKPYAQILTGASVPAMFEIFDSVENPTSVARNTLKLQDCVAPDYVAIGDWNDLVGADNWPPDTYRPDFLKPVDDIGWTLVWKPTSVLPGGFKRIVTYYGVGAASAVWNYRVGSRMEQDSVALAVQGLRSLKYNSVTGINDLDGQPFTVKAYLYNLATDPGPYDLDDVTVTLYLPPGLELATAPPQTAQQTIGRVPVNTEALPATWLVQATGEYCGEIEYFVTARAASGWQQVVSRKITVPATKRNVFRYGYQLMHVPFTFNNLAVEHAFGLPRGSFGAKYYDTATGQYLPVTQLKPGQSFWMYVGSVPRGKTQPFHLAADAAIVGHQLGKQLDEQYVELQSGWNLIGNPFVYPVYWGQVLVWNKVGNITVSLDQAVTNGWISKTLFSWIPENSSYESFKENDRLLLPWRGYWIRAKYPVTLVFRPLVPPGSDVTANADGT